MSSSVTGARGGLSSKRSSRMPSTSIRKQSAPLVGRRSSLYWRSWRNVPSSTTGQTSPRPSTLQSRYLKLLSGRLPILSCVRHDVGLDDLLLTCRMHNAVQEVVRQLNEPGLMRLGARLQVDAIQQAIKSNDARRQIAEVTPLLTSSIWATVQAQLRTSDEASAAGRSGNDQDSNQSQTGSQSGQMQRRLEHRQRRALFEYLSESMLSLYEIRVAQVRKMHGMGTCDDAIAKAEGMIVINALDLEWQQYLQYTSNLKVLANVRSFGRWVWPRASLALASIGPLRRVPHRKCPDVSRASAAHAMGCSATLLHVSSDWRVLKSCQHLCRRNNSNKKATELLQEMYDERGEGDVDASNMNSLGGIQDKRQRGGGPDEPDVERIGSSGDDRDRPEPMWG
eukprot:scaffold488_cov372-Prasinococcus_capsulatus_cf.AAC.4